MNSFTQKGHFDLSMARYILRQSTEATLWINETGDFTFVNPAAEKLLGYAVPEFGEMIVTDITPTYNAEQRQVVRQRLSERKSLNLEVPFTASDGKDVLLQATLNLMPAPFDHLDCVFLREPTWAQPLIVDPDQSGLVGQSEAFLALKSQADQLTPLDFPIMIEGETGTGKSALARYIHERSPRNKHPFVAVNCANISESMAESELFGHVAGAFTDARDTREGLFTQANGGTLFLDEIGELSPAVQRKLLLAVENGEFTPVGSSRPQRTDVRLISATNAKLQERCADGTFRPDLLHRIAPFQLYCPPLRQRREGIPLLIVALLQKLKQETNLVRKDIPLRVVEQLRRMPLAGNVRELKNHLLNYIVLGTMPEGSNTQVLGTDEHASLDEQIRDIICNALRLTNGKISGKGGAAQLLQMNAKTLDSKIKKLGIDLRRF